MGRFRSKASQEGQSNVNYTAMRRKYGLNEEPKGFVALQDGNYGCFRLRSSRKGTISELVRRNGQWIIPVGTLTRPDNSSREHHMRRKQMTILTETRVNLANAHYQALGNKNTIGVAELLHSDVHLIGPLGEQVGMEAVLPAVTKFATLLKSLRVRASFGSRDKAMVNYEVDFGEPFGICRSAALITVSV
jgi:hypothetical protein